MSGSTRLLIAAGVGAVAVAVLSIFMPWQLTALGAWDAAAVTHLALVWGSIVRRREQSTRSLATSEDDSRAMSSLILLLASSASLIGVFLGVVKANQESGYKTAVLTVVAVLSVVLSWATVHTVFTLRYAHLYYRGEPGGIDFNPSTPGEDPRDEPDYSDFAYLAFTVGMTYQVSDTNVSDRAIRRTITRHALLSFLFGTVIIGVTINVIGGFIK